MSDPISAFEALKNNDIDAFRHRLDKINFEQISIFNSDWILSRMLTSAKIDDQQKFVVVIIERWSKTLGGDQYANPVENPTDVLSLIIKLRMIEDDVLKFVLKIYEEKITLVELAIVLIDGPSDSETVFGLSRLFIIFGRTTNNNYQLLYDYAYQIGNSTCADYLFEQVADTADPANIPPWVGNFTGVEILPDDSDIEYPQVISSIDKLPTFDEAVHLLSEGQQHLKLENFSIEQIEKHLSLMSDEDFELYITPFVVRKARIALSDDLVLFRLMGPAHPIIGGDLSQDHPCYRWGGCRMFLCGCRENYDDIDEDIYGNSPDLYPYLWFTGACEVCNFQIERPFHAVRLPLYEGGWKGTYCSFDCLRQSIDSEDISSKELIHVYEKDLIQNGTQDRFLSAYE